MQQPSVEEISAALSHPAVICPHCGNGAGTGHQIIEDFLFGRPLNCQSCHQRTNGWDALLATLSHPVPFLHDFVAHFVGYRTTIFSVDLAPGGTAPVSFESHGVPPGSRILRLNYTANGPVHPVELHSNEVLFRRTRNVVILYGKPAPADASELKAVQVSVYVTYAEPTADEPVMIALANAFAALSAGELVDMVIPATMAVEFTCKRIIKELRDPLRLNTAGIKDKKLLSSIVPQIAGHLDMPTLSAVVTSKVMRLWGQRDSVAHSGRLHEPYSRANAVPQLVAAILAFRYICLLRERAKERGLIATE